MKYFAAAITLGAASALDAMQLKYMNYLAQYGKQLADIEEFHTRLVLFSAHDQFIEERNAEGHSYTLGHNQFSDWSRAE